MKKYHIAEINVARMKGVNIEDPIMKEFVDNFRYGGQGRGQAHRGSPGVRGFAGRHQAQGPLNPIGCTVATLSLVTVGVLTSGQYQGLGFRV